MGVDWTGIGAGIGGLGSLWAAGQADQASKRMADAILRASEREAGTTRRITEPALEQQRYALPRLRAAILGEAAGEMGPTNPLLRVEHGENVTAIGRAKRRALGQSSAYWGRSGNVSKARSDALSIERWATEALGSENLGYAEGQTAYGEGKRSRYIQGLMSLANIGSSAMGPAIQGAGALARGQISAAQVRGAGASDFYNDIGELGGVGIGNWMDREEERRLTRTRKALAKKGLSYGEAGASGIMDRVA